MTRRHVTFECEGERLVGTLDEATGTSGLLIVSGGNEIRSGAFSGQAQLAAKIARAGFPVFRFDRRGVGDSSGENLGFRDSALDIIAAAQEFRSLCPQVERVVAFGNCDAASALMLMRGDGADALMLSNPWTFEDDQSDATPPAAVRQRYAEKLRNPREIARLLTGGVNLAKLAGGLKTALSPSPPPTSLAQQMIAGLDASTKPHTILLATADRTAQAFPADGLSESAIIRRCDGADHAFSAPSAREWLAGQILEMLRG